MIALLLADLRHRRRMLLALSGGCFAFLLALAGTYTAYGGEDAFAKVFSNDAGGKLVTALSGSTDVSVFRPKEFVAFGFVHPLFLVLALAVAVSVGAGAVACDVETWRAAVLYAAPRPRAAILRTRLGVWAVAQASVVLGGALGALLGTRVSGDLAGVSPWVVLRVAVQFFPLAFAIAAAAFAASAATRTKAAASGIAIGVAAGGYLVNVVAQLWSPIGWARRATPFAYYRPTHAAAHVVWSDAAALTVAGVVLLAVATSLLQHRDLA